MSPPPLFCAKSGLSDGEWVRKNALINYLCCLYSFQSESFLPPPCIGAIIPTKNSCWTGCWSVWPPPPLIFINHASFNNGTKCLPQFLMFSQPCHVWKVICSWRLQQDLHPNTLLKSPPNTHMHTLISLISSSRTLNLDRNSSTHTELHTAHYHTHDLFVWCETVWAAHAEHLRIDPLRRNNHRFKEPLVEIAGIQKTLLVCVKNHIFLRLQSPPKSR